MHNTMVKSLLDMKQEMLAKEKIELDRIFTDLIAVIEACYTSPYQGSQWEEVEKFKDIYHKEWDIEGRRVHQFSYTLQEMSDRVTGGQDTGAERRANRIYTPPPR